MSKLIFIIMTLVERDPEFRARLVALYLDDNLGMADCVIACARMDPAKFLATEEDGNRLVLGLEVWAAILDQRHPAIMDASELSWMDKKRWRLATQAKDTLEALLLLSQSPFGEKFADDVHALRPRLFAIVQEDEKYDRQRVESPDTDDAV